jgi:hypothetical protein
MLNRREGLDGDEIDMKGRRVEGKMERQTQTRRKNQVRYLVRYVVFLTNIG